MPFSYALLLGVYLVLRLHAFADLTVLSFPDTATYLSAATQPLFSLSLFAGSRSAGYPLLCKAAGADPLAIVHLQWMISVLCWSFLALTTTRCLTRNWLKLPALALILAFSLAPPVLMWDRVLLSESLALSLFAFLTAASLLLFSKWSAGRIFLVAFASIFWAITKDSNAVGLLLTSLLWCALALFGVIPRRSGLALCAFLGIIVVFSSWSVTEGRRWVAPQLNIISQRILPREKSLSFFAASGMPVSSALLRHSRDWRLSKSYRTDPALEGFHLWFEEHGRATYLSYLLRNPLDTLRHPVGTRAYFLYQLSPNLSHFVPSGFQSPLPHAVQAFLFPRHLERLFRWITFAVAAALLSLFLSRGRDPVLWVPLGFLITAYPIALSVFHGDANETGRHSLTLGIQVRLGAWLLLLFLARWNEWGQSSDRDRLRAERPPPEKMP